MTNGAGLPNAAGRGWLRDRAREMGQQDAPKRKESLRRGWSARSESAAALAQMGWLPWLIVATYATLTFLTAVGLTHVAPELLPSLAPGKNASGEALLTMWQVQTTIVAIGLGLSALVIQLVPHRLSLQSVSRKLIVQVTMIKPIFATNSILVLTLGAIAIWTPSDAALVVAFFACLVPCVAMVLYANIASLWAFTRPEDVFKWAADELLRRYENASQEAKLETLANLEITRYESDALSAFVPLDSDTAPKTVGLSAWMPGTIADVNLHRLSVLATRFRNSHVAMATLQPSALDSDSLELPQVVLHARLGSDLVRGDTLITICGALRAGLTIQQFASEAAKCMKIDRPDSDSVDLDRELGVLRDELLKMLETNQLTDARELLRVFTSLFERDFEQDDWNRRGRTIQSHQYEIAITVGAIEGRARHAVEGWLFDRLSSATKRRSTVGLDHVLSEVSAAHSALLRSDETGAETAHLLLLFSNFFDFALSESAIADSDFRIDARSKLVRTAFDMLRESLDKDARVGWHYLHEMLSRWSPDRSGRRSREDGVAELIRAGYLVLLAWETIRLPGPDEPEPDALAAARSWCDHDAGLLWRTYLRASQEIEGGTGWGHWEGRTFDTPFGGGGFLQMPAAVNSATAQVALKSGIQLPELTDDQTIKDRVWILREALDGVTSGESEEDSLRGELDDWLNAWESKRLERLKSQPADPGRVNSFLEGLAEPFTHAHPEAPLMRFTVREASPADAESDQSFGLARRLPMEFFVEDGFVHADPAHLGRDFGLAILRGEQAQVVENLAANATTSELALNDANEKIRALRNELGAELEVVSNSWRLAVALNPGNDLASGFEAIPGIGRMHQVYDDLDDWLIVVASGTHGYLEVSPLASSTQSPVPNTTLSYSLEAPADNATNAEDIQFTVRISECLRWVPNPAQQSFRFQLIEVT